MRYNRIKSSLKKAYLLEPVFKTKGMFSIVFFRPEKKITQKTTRKILAIIKDDPQITRRELTEKNWIHQGRWDKISCSPINSQIDLLRSQAASIHGNALFPILKIAKATAASRKSALTFTLRILNSHDEKLMNYSG